jgi:hypothetical protein
VDKLFAIVDFFPQFLADFEERQPFGFNLNFLPGFRVSAFV